MTAEQRSSRSLTQAELEAGLDTPLSELTGRGIVKVAIASSWDPEQPGKLDLMVHTLTPDGRAQRWLLDMGVDDATLDGLTAQGFIVTLRANIEEWWAVKDYEPDTAALATLLA